MTRHVLAAAVVLSLASTAGAAPQTPVPQSPDAREPDRPTPFDQGRVRVALSGGTAGSTNNRYFVIGAGVGVFVWDGLEVATDVEAWLGGDPNVTKLSPSLRYIVFQIPTIHPYIGGLYRHWFVGDDQDDIDTLGGRLGIITILGDSLFAGGGVVHEVIVSECDDDCTETYPEIFFSVSF